MKKIGHFISRLPRNKSKNRVTYEYFKDMTTITNITSSFTSELSDILSWKSIYKDEYIRFLEDAKYPKKNSDSFYEYYVDKYRNIAIGQDPDATKYMSDGGELEIRFKPKDEKIKELYGKEGKDTTTIYIETKEKLKEEFHRFVQIYMENCIDEFLKDKNKQYSERYEGFVDYLKAKKPFILDAFSERKIRKIYTEGYQEYLKHQEKNEFWLDLKDVEKHLRDIFSWSGVGDGTFMYAWKTSEDGGVEKYQKVAESNIYKSIESTEKKLYEYVLSWGEVSLGFIHHVSWSKEMYSKEEVYRGYRKIADLLLKSRKAAKMKKVKSR